MAEPTARTGPATGPWQTSLGKIYRARGQEGGSFDRPGAILSAGKTCL